jgi:Fe(3+) dicitrate transport protein
LGLTLLTARGSLGATAVHRGAMRDQAGQGVIPEAEAIPAATWVDLNGELRLYKGLRLYGLVRNVGDTVILESYRPDGARPGAPRTLIAGLKLAPETK